MDPVDQRILRVFDELGRERVDLHALLELAGGKEAAQRAGVLDALARLAGSGLLRAEGGDFYARTEDGRIAVAGPRDVTLYTRPGCHLCEEMKLAMAPLLAEFGATLREVDVDADPVLRERYGNDVPVIFLGTRKVAKHRLDREQFRRQLARATD